MHAHRCYVLLGAVAMVLATASVSAAPALRALPATAAATAAPEKEAARTAAWDRRFATMAPATTGPSLALASDAVALTLDAFGSFGHATAGGDAFFSDGAHRAATVFEYMPHVKGLGFLDSTSLLRPASSANPGRSGDVVTASYQLGSFRFDLASRLENCTTTHCAVLTQEWTVTNVAQSGAPLVMSFYLDGDLFFTGAYDNDYAALKDGVLYEFDSGSDPAAPSTFLGLSSEAPAARTTIHEVGEYSDQRRRLQRNQPLAERLVRATGAPADMNGDGITDAGFDVSLALQHDFGTLASGASVTLVSRVQWGVGTLNGLSGAPVADAGPDVTVECGGASGTAVLLDGRASEPAADLVAYHWSVDGAAVGDGPSLEVVLLPGVHQVTLEVVDSQGRTAVDHAVVEVVDRTPPEVSTGAPVQLWPPDHRLVRVSLPVRANDVCSDQAFIQVVEVSSDELDEIGRGGDGMTRGDIQIDADGSIWLRRERVGRGDGRVYRVHGLAIDDAGNATPFAVEFHVPHSPSEPARDSGVALSVRP